MVLVSVYMMILESEYYRCGGASLIVDGNETLAVGNNNDAVTCH